LQTSQIDVGYMFTGRPLWRDSYYVTLLRIPARCPGARFTLVLLMSYLW